MEWIFGAWAILGLAFFVWDQRPFRKSYWNSIYTSEWYFELGAFLMLVLVYVILWPVFALML